MTSVLKTSRPARTSREPREVHRHVSEHWGELHGCDLLRAHRRLREYGRNSGSDGRRCRLPEKFPAWGKKVTFQRGHRRANCPRFSCSHGAEHYYTAGFDMPERPVGKVKE